MDLLLPLQHFTKLWHELRHSWCPKLLRFYNTGYFLNMTITWTLSSSNLKMLDSLKCLWFTRTFLWVTSGLVDSGLATYWFKAISFHRSYLTYDTWMLEWRPVATVHRSWVCVAPMGTGAHILTEQLLIYAVPTRYTLNEISNLGSFSARLYSLSTMGNRVCNPGSSS